MGNLMSSIAAGLLKPKSVFGNNNFMFLFSGKVISQLGDQICAFSLSWFILDITKSSLAMSIFLVINCLIGAVVSPFGGIIADRFDRKKILVWMDIVRGIIVAFASLLLHLQMMQIWMLYVSTIILGFCGAIFSPTASAIIPNVVTENQLTEASSMDLFVGNFSSIAGMVIGSILYSLIGIAAVFLLNAISYFISGVLEAIINIPLIKQTGSIRKNSSLYREFRQAVKSLHEGYQYVKTNKLLYNLTLVYAVYFFIGFPLGYIYVPYTFNVILKAIPLQLSLALGATFLGCLIGSFIVPLFLKRCKLKSAIFGGMLIFSFSYLIVASIIFTPLKGYFNNWEITILWAILSIIVGVGMISFNIPINVIFQKHTLNEYRGRFWGFQSSIIAFSMGMGYLIGGVLAQNVWMGFLFAGSSLAIFTIDLWAVNIKEIKEFNR
jgi:MFS family permease